MGHALTQMPQAVHLLEYGVFSSLTIRPKGQASTHLPQPVQSLRLIIQTPFGFWVMAPEGQAFYLLLETAAENWERKSGRML